MDLRCVISESKHVKFINVFSKNGFCFFVKQFSTSGIIKSTYKAPKEVYFGGCSIDSLQRYVTERDVKNGQILELSVLIQPWQFTDLIYKSIVYSNDYKGVIDINDNIFLLSLVETGKHIALLTKSMIEEPHSKFDLFLFKYGFEGELYIIFSITKKCSSAIKPEEIVKQEIGVEWKDLILVLFGIFIDSLFHQDINKAINYLDFDQGKNKDEIFKKVTDYYSADYDTIRNNSFGRQIFYVKPYIKTQKMVY